MYARGSDNNTEFSKGLNSFFRGIVIDDRDPNEMQRVKIYIPELTNLDYNKESNPGLVLIAPHSIGDFSPDLHKHLMSILIDENILSQNRNDVHFALGYLDETLEDGTKVKSGMRKSSTIGLEIDVTNARKDGIKFYQSKKNKVVLVRDSLSAKYINKIVHLDTNIEDELQINMSYYILT